MAKKPRVLFISQEMYPYLPDSKISKVIRNLTQGTQESGKEIRTFIPRYGCINERRHQLHEVIRLSGMNIIINDTDHPLIIKVASLPAARMQVYFIDNDEFFQRKHVHHGANGKFFEDNDERAIFFGRGVIETVKKLGWQPDIIHCHGWMTSLVPAYIKKVYADEPLFTDAKVVFSAYNDAFDKPFDKNFVNKALHNGLTASDLKIAKEPTHTAVNKLAIQYSDGVIIGEDGVSADVLKYIKTIGKPSIAYSEEDTYIEEFNNFYQTVLEGEEVIV
ncbi:MAG: glycogen/starch synthase [Bacteroidia bacterium]|nr:glycogen/starch synthase [Bacteroidia bacterium]